MPKVKEVIQTLQKLYDPEMFVAYSIWDMNDIKQAAVDRNKICTDETAEEILQVCMKNPSDINWTLINDWVDELCLSRNI